MIYKMTLLPLPWFRSVIEKEYQSTIFKAQNPRPVIIEYELDHASKLPTLGVTKSNTKMTF